MKKTLIVLTMLISLFAFIKLDIYASDDEIERTIKYINDIRSNYGLNEYKLNDKLENVAITHNKYMYHNNSFSSIEESGKLYYRGRYPWDRATYFLYNEPYVYEFISNTNKTYIEGINDLLNNPYSRNILLDPVYEEIGMNNFENMYTYVIGGTKRNKDYEIIYPYNEQKNVPIIWENNYIIDPYENYNLEDNKYGLPITYTYYSDSKQVDYFNIRKIKLINSNTNKEVSCEIITPKTDRYLKNSIMLLPMESYEYQQTYQIEMEFDIYFKDNTKKKVTINQQFNTEEDINQLNKEKLLTRGKFTEEIVKALGYELLEPFEIKFYDIDIRSSSAKYIYTAYINGFINGYLEGDINYFKPELNINKEQAYAILVRAYESKYNKIYNFEKVDLNDYNELSSWSIKENIIEKANKIGILIKDKNNNLNPKEYLTVNEFNLILDKYKKVINNK